MSSISSLTSATDPYQATNLNAFVQFVNNFNAIGNALQSGNVTDAQSALATFQQDLPGGNSQSTTAQPFGNNTQANTDFKSLSTALQSGDLTGARQAYASLQNDLQDAGTGKVRRHHHHGSEASETTPPADSTEETSTGSDTADEDSPLLDALA